MKMIVDEAAHFKSRSIQKQRLRIEQEIDTMKELENLQDTRLVDMAINWDRAEALFRFSAGLGDVDEVLVRANGMTLLKCPRRLPWGISSYVSNVRSIRSDGQIAVEINMESGDMIEFEIADFAIDTNYPSADGHSERH